MKTLILILVLLSSFEPVIAEDKKGETLDFNTQLKFDIQLKIEEKFCERFGSFISKNQDWSSIRPNNLRQKHVEVYAGELHERNPNNYYLWVDAYDIDGNNIDDLIAIDWIKVSAKMTWYLAYYVFFDMGHLYGPIHYEKSTDEELRKYFLSLKLQYKHGVGDEQVPWFPEDLLVRDKQGIIIVDGFAGFHQIKPVLFENKVLIVAKRKNERSTGLPRTLLFSFDAIEKKINLLCVLDGWKYYGE